MLFNRLNKNFFRILTIIWWSSVAGITMVLLIAAVKAKNEKECSGIEIQINGSVPGRWFVEKADIIKMLTLHGTERIKGKQMHRFDLKNMESRLRKDIWIKDAELFFDNRNILQVKVIERIPVARVFTVAGYSFYIDSSGQKLPLSSKVSVRLPVFTGFPVENLSRKKDSTLMSEIKSFSTFILNDAFWMSQVSQIDITSSGQYLVIPTIGTHTIQFGNAYNIDRKFQKLMLFYKQVLVKTGFEKYKMIDIQFEGQVIGVKKDGPEQKINQANN